MVGASREQQRVDVVERVDDYVFVGKRRDNHWHASGIRYLCVVAVAQRGVSVGVVCRYAYQRLACRLRISRVNVFCYRVEIK